MRIEEQLRRVSYIFNGIVFQMDSGEIASILSVDKSKLMRATRKVHTDEGPINEDFQRIFEETLGADLSTALSVFHLISARWSDRYMQPVFN